MGSQVLHLRDLAALILLHTLEHSKFIGMEFYGHPEGQTAHMSRAVQIDRAKLMLH